MNHTPAEEEQEKTPAPESGDPDREQEEGSGVQLALEKAGDSEISTILLRAGASPGTKLWETMVIGGRLDDVTVRCSGTREQAKAMHAEVVRRVREASAL